MSACVVGGVVADPPLSGSVATTPLSGSFGGGQGISGPPGKQGDPGPPGPAGPAGAQGAPGTAATSFVFYQPQPSPEWAVTHNLGRYPSVTVVDTAGSVIDTTITYVDSNNVLIDFTPPAAGYAYLN